MPDEDFEKIIEQNPESNDIDNIDRWLPEIFQRPDITTFDKTKLHFPTINKNLTTHPLISRLRDGYLHMKEWTTTRNSKESVKYCKRLRYQFDVIVTTSNFEEYRCCNSENLKTYSNFFKNKISELRRSLRRFQKSKPAPIHPQHFPEIVIAIPNGMKSEFFRTIDWMHLENFDEACNVADTENFLLVADFLECPVIKNYYHLQLEHIGFNFATLQKDKTPKFRVKKKISDQKNLKLLGPGAPGSKYKVRLDGLKESIRLVTEVPRHTCLYNNLTMNKAWKPRKPLSENQTPKTEKKKETLGEDDLRHKLKRKNEEKEVVFIRTMTESKLALLGDAPSNNGNSVINGWQPPSGFVHSNYQQPIIQHNPSYYQPLSHKQTNNFEHTGSNVYGLPGAPIPVKKPLLDAINYNKWSDVKEPLLASQSTCMEGHTPTQMSWMQPEPHQNSYSNYSDGLTWRDYQ